jgi:hypothetical protein
MAREISHPLINSVLQGENKQRFTKIASDILDRIRKGKTRDGKELIDSKGNPAPGLSTSSDDRYNKWVLLNLILSSNTDDIELFDPEDGVLIDEIYNGEIGDMFRSKYPTLEERNIYDKIIGWVIKLNDSKIINQSKRILLRNSLKDNTNYFKYGDSGAPLMKSAMMLIIKNNPDILNSEAFIKELYDPTLIADFMNSEETGRVILANSYSKVKASKRLGKLGINTRDEGDNIDDNSIASNVHKVDQLSSNIHPLLALISKEAGYKQASLTKKAKTNTPEATSTPNISPSEPEVENDNTFNALLISSVLGFLESKIKVVKQEVTSRLKLVSDLDEAIELVSDDLELDVSQIENLYNSKLGVVKALRQFLSNLKMGISFDTFFEELDKLENSYGQDSGILDTLEMVRYYIQISGKVSTYIKKETKSSYPGFDNDILSKYLDTPEKKELFDKWYSDIYRPKSINEIREKLSILNGDISKNQADENRKWKSFENQKTNIYGQEVDRTGSLDPTSNDNIKAELQSKPKEEWTTGDYILARQIGILDDEDISPEKEEEAMNAARKDIRSKLASTHKSALKGPQNESYVMGYMEEQIHKDRFQPIGTFKERGFKKMNYHEWLLKNQ